MKRHVWALIAVVGCGEVAAPSDPSTDAGNTVPGAPETTLTAMPPAIGNKTDVTFEFTADKPSVFMCKVNGDAPAACTSPKTLTVADGAHTFEVAATTTDNITDATPAKHDFTVDTVPPETSLSALPASPTNVTTAAVTLLSDEPGTFSCTIDGGAAAPCTSPLNFSALADGSHTFTAAAVDLAGNVDPSPSRYAWVVDTAAPGVVITGYPTSTVYTTTARFTFAVSGSPTITECTMYRTGTTPAGFSACSSPHEHNIPSFTGATQSFTFMVRSRDAAGNVGSATRAFIAGIIQ